MYYRIGEAEEWRLRGGLGVRGARGGLAARGEARGEAGAELVSRSARPRRPARDASRRNASCSREPVRTKYNHLSIFSKKNVLIRLFIEMDGMWIPSPMDVCGWGLLDRTIWTSIEFVQDIVLNSAETLKMADSSFGNKQRLQKYSVRFF